MFRPAVTPASIEKVATIFVRHDGEQFIVVPMHMTPSGIYYEQSDTRVICNPTSEGLGLAFQSAFNAFSIRDKNVGATKKSDWPAYHASKLKTVRAFEASYCRISCKSVNSANVTVRAQTEHPKIPDVDLSVSFNPLVSRLAGERILLLIEAVSALRGETRAQ